MLALIWIDNQFIRRVWRAVDKKSAISNPDNIRPAGSEKLGTQPFRLSLLMLLLVLAAFWAMESIEYRYAVPQKPFVPLGKAEEDRLCQNVEAQLRRAGYEWKHTGLVYDRGRPGNLVCFVTNLEKIEKRGDITETTFLTPSATVWLKQMTNGNWSAKGTGPLKGLTFTIPPHPICVSDYIGQTDFPKGDSIEITSVERTKEQMTVKGHYNLVSHDYATLALYITSTNGNVPEDATQRMEISKGRGDFELTHRHLVPGWPHVSMYADGNSFAALYFGTKVEALEESKLPKGYSLAKGDSTAATPASAELEFRLVAAEDDSNTPADELADPNDRTGQTKLRILKEVLLDSSAIASASLDPGQSEYKTISVMLKSDAAREFSDITAANIGRRLAIVWRGRVLSAPVINTKITGSAVSVTGKMSDAECQVLLDLLNFKSTPSVTSQTTQRAEVSPAVLTEPPVLQFFAWQDEWKTNQPGAARHSDGSTVTNAQELGWLRRVQPGGCDVSALKLTPAPRFLHLWFSHPLFDQSSLNEVTLLDDKSEAIPLGANGDSSGNSRSADESDDLGWLIDTLSPGAGADIPARVSVRLRYTIGPLEKTRDFPVTPKSHTSMSLEGDSELNGVGQNVDGKAFVAIAANAGKMKSRRFGVVAVTRDGRELTTSGGESSNSDGTGVRVEEFVFDVPLADVAKFIIGTRPIRTNEWRNVVLPKN